MSATAQSTFQMVQVHCNKPQHASKPIQIFFTSMQGHTGAQQFLCPYCSENEEWSGIHGEISRILIDGPKWQEYHLFQRTSFGTPTDFKREALSRGFTKIRRDVEGAKEVSLKNWPGFSTHVSGGMYATVIYYLQGNRVRIHKAMEEGDHWYTLS